MRALLRSAWSESAAAWRGTEAVITAPIRNRLGAIAPRGFESHPLSQFLVTYDLGFECRLHRNINNLNGNPGSALCARAAGD